ncbi:MAG: pseudouridine synthase [Ilumatobacteraceae bacterium]
MSEGEIEPPLWEQWAERSRSLPNGIRLQKVLARHGYGSRRASEELIGSGRVRVNGAVAELGRRVDPEHDEVSVDGVRIGIEPDLVHYLVNKPQGVVCTASDPQGRAMIVDLVPKEPRVFSIGRLDADSEGLIILTNDGALAHEVAHPSCGVDKEYLVEVSGGRVAPADLRRLRDGVLLDDGPTAPASVSQPADGMLRIVIHEGRNRQVRRMCEAIGHPVVRLIRTRIGPLQDRTLRPGAWRTLSAEEVRSLNEAVAANRRRYAHNDE